MRHMLALGVIGVLAFTGLRSSFALGEGVGGRGYGTVTAGGAGGSTDDKLQSVGLTVGPRSGGRGIGGTTATPSTNSSTDQNNQTTGGGPPIVAGKGYGTGSAQGKGFVVPIVHGIGATSAVPGGRGM